MTSATPASPDDEQPGGGAVGRKRRLTLGQVLLLTAPPLALGLWITALAALDYREVRQYEDWWTDQTSVRKFAWYRVRDALVLPRALWLERTLAAERPGVEAVRLEVKPKDWDRLQQDVPGRWDKWTDAELLLAGHRLKAEVKVRGDNSAHWVAAKKSLTIKTEEGDHYKGYRRLGLSLKAVLSQYLPSLLAHDFDLLVPDTEILPLYVNERFNGIYRFIETPDETFLRRHDLLPGNVYRADTAARGDYFPGLPRQVFLNPYIWDRTAENDRPTATGDRGLFEFIAALNGTGLEEHLRFAACYDREELSRLLGLMLLCGDPYHMSGIHNQLWYEDPAAGLLHPIVWDLRLLSPEGPPRDSRVNRFWIQALRDPRVFDGALRAVAAWIADPTKRQRALGRVREAYANYRDEFAYDRLREGWIHPVGEPEWVAGRLDANVEFLRGWLSETDVAFRATEGAAVRVREGDPGLEIEPGVLSGRSYTVPAITLDFLVEGRLGCDLVALETGGEDLGDAYLVQDANLNGTLDQEELRRPVSSHSNSGRMVLDEPEPLPAGCVADGPWFEPEPMHYRFFLVCPGERRFTHLDPVLVGRGDGHPVAAREWAAGEAIPETESFHPWALERLAEAAPQPTVLSGEVRLDEDLVVEPGGSLRIEPGAHLVLAPDVSIETRGPVTARGTAEQPIVIEAADPDRPWGSFALQGAGADGSVFAHVRLRGGGGALRGRIEYKGMVSVHHVDGVVFEDCRFERNLRCDDQLNAVLSRVDVRHCEFVDGLGDAIDFDVSRGDIERCAIRDAGNDGIDLMSCAPRILSNTIDGSGDKGISIGENSGPLVFDTLIRDCETGVEIKDRSQPLLLDSRVQGCRRGVVQDRKNWRFSGPGRGRLVGTTVAGNERDYEGSGGATATLLNASIGEDTAASSPPWFRAAYGFGEPRGTTTPPRTWERTAPSAEPYAITFEPDLHDAADGWGSRQGFEELDAHDGDLNAVLHSAVGELHRAIDWDLDAPDVQYRLVVEAAGEDLTDTVLRVESGDRAIELPLEIDADEDTFRYSTRLLPPGRYTGLTLRAAAAEKKDGGSKKAHLRLHSIVLQRRAGPAESAPPAGEGG